MFERKLSLICVLIAFLSLLLPVETSAQTQTDVQTTGGKIISISPRALVVLISGEEMTFVLTELTKYFSGTQPISVQRIPRGEPARIQYVERSGTKIALEVRVRPGLAPREEARAAAISLDEIRIQLSKEDGAAAVSRIPLGQVFYIIFIVREHSRQSGDIDFCYTGWFGVRQFMHRCDTAQNETTAAGWTFRRIFSNRITGREGTIELIGSVTMNGVTQRRRVYFTVYR